MGIGFLSQRYKKGNIVNLNYTKQNLYFRNIIDTRSNIKSFVDFLFAKNTTAIIQLRQPVRFAKR